jgi:hypothetical protein
VAEPWNSVADKISSDLEQFWLSGVLSLSHLKRISMSNESFERAPRGDGKLMLTLSVVALLLTGMGLAMAMGISP